MNSNQHKSAENWDAALGRALKDLPERQAPSALLSQVMAQVNAHAVERSNQQVWRRRWTWATTCALLLAIAMWFSWLGGKFYETNINPVLDRCIGICRTVFNALVGSLIGNNSGFGCEVSHFTLLAVSLLLLAMYVTCVGVGSFVYRVVRR